MRVLHVLDHSIPLHSGYTFRSLALLREQRRLGWQTFHLTSPKHGESAGAGASGETTAAGADEDVVDGWHFFRTPLATPSRWPGWRELRLMQALERRLDAVVQRVQPDVLHAHSPVLNAAPALRVGARLGIPVVYEVRAFWEDAAVDHGSTHAGSLRYRLTRAYETRALQRAAHVFTICQGLRSDIIERGLPPERVTVIPNAVDIEDFAPGTAPDPALRGRLGLEGCTVLGFLGSFYAYEGLDLLVRAMPALLAQRPDVRLLLVGGGPQEAALKAQVQALGLAGQVVFTGRVPHSEVGRYYDLMDVLVYARHSMRLTELVTPLKPLEAMAQGRLLVASDVGGHRELIRDGDNGLLFSAGSAEALVQCVLGLLAAPESWARLKQRARAFVESERNWRTSVANYVAPYSRLLA